MYRYTHLFTYMYKCMQSIFACMCLYIPKYAYAQYNYILCFVCAYGVATISRLLKIIGLFRKRAL